MRTEAEIRADPTLTIYGQAEALTELRRAQVANPEPPPEPPPLPAETLTKIKTALQTGLASLASHDARVLRCGSLVESLQVSVRGALTAIDLEDRSALQTYIFDTTKLELARTFLANASAIRAQICARLESELNVLTETLKKADRFDFRRPPGHTAGHGLEAKVDMAIHLIETLLPK